MLRTKIVCTLGPASGDAEVVRGLVRAGMSVARINFSHGDHATHQQAMQTVRRVAAEERRLVAIMADLQGPKLRVGRIPGGSVELLEGETVTLALELDGGQRGVIPVPHPELLGDLDAGERVLLDDGGLELEVLEEGRGRVLCRVIIGGLLSSHKGINVPTTNLHFSAVTDKDREDVQFALAHDVDFFAASFVRSAADIQELRRLIRDAGAHVAIVAKIEKREALVRFDEILDAANGVMVARGDLGVETPPEQVPFHQKHIIQLCNRVGKPVITATQMLQSMIESPRPTRAEASDVANAILDGTDAVMLSGETAVGQYPVRAAQTMAAICANAEAHLACHPVPPSPVSSPDAVTGAISYAAVRIAEEVGAKAIVTATMSGTTARMVARHRPPVPIIAVTPNEVTLDRLALVWGVIPMKVAGFSTTDEMVHVMIRAAREAGLAAPGERVVLTAGIPFGVDRGTNMLKVQAIDG
ncbi:MAG: pyruvate kinase [Anaerolineales bacterium]|nr:pyruvate kinase [Anaerolineales bacterium]